MEVSPQAYQSTTTVERRITGRIIPGGGTPRPDGLFRRTPVGGGSTMFGDPGEPRTLSSFDSWESEPPNDWDAIAPTPTTFPWTPWDSAAPNLGGGMRDDGSWNPPLGFGEQWWLAMMNGGVGGGGGFIGGVPKGAIILWPEDANIPSGWWRCNKANAAKSPKNGVTIPNLEGLSLIFYGNQANQTLSANDTAYDYNAIGAVLGFNDHGGALNNHNDHENLSAHTHGGTVDSDGAHDHRLTTNPTKILVDNAGGAQTPVINGGRTDADPGHQHSFTTAAAGGLLAEWDEKHSGTDNRTPSYVLVPIIKVK